MNELLRRLLLGGCYREQATDGTQGGSGGASAAADTKPTDTAAPADTSLLDEPQDGAAAQSEAKPADDASLTPEQRAAKAAEKDTRRPKHVPSKFWNAEKGEINVEAWAKSTSELEGRIRDIGLPPKSAEEYAYDAPTEFKQAGVELDPDALKSLRDFAHKAGFSQKQFGELTSALYRNAMHIVDLGERMDKAQTLKALGDHYKTPDLVQANVRAAYAVFQAYADEEEMQHLYRVVNDPIAVRVLAKINKELQEDAGIRGEAILSGDSIETLMAKDSPYWDAEHPQHQRTKKRVQAHFQAKANADARKRAA